MATLSPSQSYVQPPAPVASTEESHQNGTHTEQATENGDTLSTTNGVTTSEENGAAVPADVASVAAEQKAPPKPKASVSEDAKSKSITTNGTAKPGVKAAGDKSSVHKVTSTG